MSKSLYNALSCHTVALDQDQVEADAIKAIEWLAAKPLRTPLSVEFKRWAELNEPPWTPGYIKAVRNKVLDHLREVSATEAAEARAVLLDGIAQMLPKCEQYVMGQGPSERGSSEGTVALKDPHTGEYLKQYDHKAIQGYQRLIGELTGALDTQGTSKITGPVMIVTGVPTETKSDEPRTVDAQVTSTELPSAADNGANTPGDNTQA